MTGSAWEITVTLPCPAWKAACPQAVRLARAAARLALERSAPAGSGPVELGITLTDDDAQRRLNRDYRGRDAATNVLAFPAAEPAVVPPVGAPLLLGDVVLAFESVRREADEQQKAFADHLRHLVVHGVLHLLGHDHESEREACAMETLETEILARMGVPDPYRETM